MNYDWWARNQRNVKSKLTRAEKLIKTDPDRALEVADEVERLFEEFGWPDWWSRVERLRWDATSSKQRRSASW